MQIQHIFDAQLSTSPLIRLTINPYLHYGLMNTHQERHRSTTVVHQAGWHDGAKYVLPTLIISNNKTGSEHLLESYQCRGYNSASVACTHAESCGNKIMK